MCTVCGCNQDEHKIENNADPSKRPYDTHGGHLHYGHGPAHAHAPGLSQSRMVQIERDILGKNAEYADANRLRLISWDTLTLNLISSPGAGKTSLLLETLRCLQNQCPLGVIEGDQQTTHDADRIRTTGVAAIQINTGKGCHLDAHMIGHALDHIGSILQGILFIENVGNLVCPAGFDLGETHKIVILSVTEGEDKPIKYPDIFHAADLMLLNKTDLLPYVDFDTQRCIAYARRINPDIEIIPISARTMEGVDQWLAWINSKRAAMPRAYSILS